MAKSKVLNRIKKWMVNQGELPADLMLDLPRITMIGQLHFYIENHKGVLSFSNEELRLALARGSLLIQGQQFVLKTILPEELLLEGTVSSVRFLDTENTEAE